MKRVHFVGIAGTGISALARVDLERGESVSGSDLRSNALTDSLAAAGARIFVGHRAENVHGADLVIISSAVRADNPEVLEARRLGIPVLKRADYLGQLMAGQRPICIAGTHGKTTTTAMIALLLDAGGLEPSFIIGGNVAELGGNARAGRGTHFVIEADEYDGMFLGLTPWVAVITNVELDHVDCYPTLVDMQRAFSQFAGQTVADGLLLVCADDPSAVETLRRTTARSAGRPAPTPATYGIERPADWTVEGLTPNTLGGTSFTVQHGGQPAGDFELAVPGRHNVANALAALAVGFWVGLQADDMAAALRRFRGAGRRFELKGEAAGVTVVDDYAHHPTEIRATLQAARQRFPGRRVWAVFQPHTYSRLEAFFAEFAQSLGEADQVIVTDIYAARERDTGTVSASALAARVAGRPARYIVNLDEAARYLLEQVQPGDVVITLGAGDGDRVGEQLLDGLRRREGTKPVRSGRPHGSCTDLADELRDAGLELLADEPLAAHTSYRIGGPADLFAYARSAADLAAALRAAAAHATPHLLLGGGSNLLASDSGFRGLVICNRCTAVKHLAEQGQDGPIEMLAETGIGLPALARQAAAQGLGGLAWAEGIPGTLGGAIVNNAGAFGASMADSVTEVAWVDAEGRQDVWAAQQMEFGYRCSRLKGSPGAALLAAKLRLTRSDAATERRTMEAYAEQRRQHQPTGASAGSVFKNPAGQSAGRLIEEAGLKGKRIGGAQVSPKHANFIINDQRASAGDVRALIELVRSAVWQRFGILLELEIELVGAF